MQKTYKMVKYYYYDPEAVIKGHCLTEESSVDDIRSACGDYCWFYNLPLEVRDKMIEDVREILTK